MIRSEPAPRATGRPWAAVALVLLAGCGDDDRADGPGGSGDAAGLPRVSFDVAGGDAAKPVTVQMTEGGGESHTTERRIVVRVQDRIGFTLDSDDALQAGDQVRFDARIQTERGGTDPSPASPSAMTLVLRAGKRECARYELGHDWKTFWFEPEDLGQGAALSDFALEVESAGSGLGPKALIATPWVARPSSPQPTVILITSDTHRADHVSAINPSSPIATPHLDAVAKEGALFTNCYTSANNTNPSHIALLTGVHPRDAKIVNNRTRLHESAQTLAERFQAEGYRTYAALSAFHLFDEISGLGQGFDRMNSTKGLARDAEDTLAIAGQWVDDAEGAPLFLWIHLFDVHSPYVLPEDQMAALLDGRPDPSRADVSLGVDEQYVPEWLKARGIRDPEFVRALYAGEVQYLDGHLGEFLARPRIASATIAITADHGEGLGERDIWWSHFGVLTPMVHVPLILRGPGVPAGARTDVPVRQIDIGRTLLNLQGLGSVEFPGRDLTQSLGSSDAESRPSDPRFAISGHGISASIEQGGWMFELFMRNGRVLSSGREHPVGTCSLFHVETDPLCRRDVLLDEFDRALRMRAALIEWLENAEPTGLNSLSYEITAEQSAKLEELGYSGGYESMLRWWAPELLDKSWATNPWNLAFEGDGDPSLLSQ